MKTRLLAIFTIAVCAFAMTPRVSAEQFQIRGIKGLWWNGIENYQKAVPWLAEHNLNFLMLCYSSFPASGKDWRSDYTPQEREQFGELAKQAKDKGITLCLSFNPGIWSNPPLTYSSDQDYQLALNKVKSVSALGMDWISLCLDDINRELQPADKGRFGSLQAAQVYFVNRLWRDMKKASPRAKLIFCPSAYTTEDMVAHQDYIQTIGDGIDKDVMLFWTGPTVCAYSITSADAKKVEQWFHRKPFIWDNYPVNDMYNWRILVSPLKNRSADLASATSGYMANPMKQWTLSTIPLTTTAAYVNDTAGYNPQREMEKVIKSYPADQQRAIRLLVELYGSTFWGEPNFPPKPGNNRADAWKLIPKYRALQKELSTNPGMKDLWEDSKQTIQDDIATLDRQSRDRFSESPLKARGDDFEGGAAEIFGYTKWNRFVNYIYAQPTGKNEMHTEFRLDKAPESGATLRLIAREDDQKTKPKILILMNNFELYNGPSPFGDFEARDFKIPAECLKTGSNVLSIRNLELKGTLGSPPWFMVAEAEIVVGKY